MMLPQDSGREVPCTIKWSKDITRQELKVVTSMKMIHPGRLTWNLRLHPWKRKIIFQTIIFTFYVNLPGCKFFLHHVFLFEWCNLTNRLTLANYGMILGDTAFGDERYRTPCTREGAEFFWLGFAFGQNKDMLSMAPPPYVQRKFRYIQESLDTSKEILTLFWAIVELYHV